MKDRNIGTHIKITEGDTITALKKGMAILELFDTERQRFNATIAAQRTGMTRAAARRYLLTLASIGYLETDGSFYWLTSKVLRFSGSYLASARLPKVIQPTLNRLAGLVGESFSAAVLDGDESVIIGRGGPTRLVAYGLHLGARLPAHATSTGKVLLANLPDEQFENWLNCRHLQRLTAQTIVDKEGFLKTIETVRSNDYCLADQEYELGVTAVAVPVRDFQGHTVAALNAVFPTQSLGKEKVAELINYLQEGAKELRAII